MKLVPAVLLLGLLVFACVWSDVVARGISRGPFGVSAAAAGARKGTSPDTTAVVTVGKCKPQGNDLCAVPPLSETNSTMEEEKRRVPTGPNPLHNRDVHIYDDELPA
ncbi:hypothetical protein ACLOJK_030727 [Asimina triloba]